MTTPATAYLDDDSEYSFTDALFAGDEGTLDVDQRRVLVVMLKQRFISNRTHPAEWKALTADPRAIRARLHDLFLELVLDTEREVAYKKQVVTEGSGRTFPTLLYDNAWSREETILLVYLRTRARAEQASGVSRAYVDRVDLLDYVEQHRDDRATDKSADERRAKNAIDALCSAGLLLGRSDDDRFEISRAVESLLPLEKLNSLLEWLHGENDPDDELAISEPTIAGPADDLVDEGDTP